MSSFVILLAGPIKPTPALQAAVAGRRTIAADGGIAHAAALQLRPELWVGDFDSAPPELASGLAGVARRSFPRDKDRTDAELAVEAALERGASDLLFVGALGGRTDHAFSNLVILLRLAERGVPALFQDGHERAYALSTQPRSYPAERGAPFSVLRFGDVAGLTIEGARWPLHDVSVPFLSILTQSNEATGPVCASVTSGRAVLVVQESPERPA